jgi:hypothetical protein
MIRCDTSVTRDMEGGLPRVVAKSLACRGRPPTDVFKQDEVRVVMRDRSRRVSAHAPATRPATNQVDPADRAHLGRTPALGSASGMSHGEFVETLENDGLIPSGAIPTGAATEASGTETGLR